MDVMTFLPSLRPSLVCVNIFDESVKFIFYNNAVLLQLIFYNNVVHVRHYNTTKILTISRTLVRNRCIIVRLKPSLEQSIVLLGRICINPFAAMRMLYDMTGTKKTNLKQE